MANMNTDRKVQKLVAMVYHPSTPSHEADAALARLIELRAKQGWVCGHERCIDLLDCRVCTECEAVIVA